jgi:hypothetical protein
MADRSSGKCRFCGNEGKLRNSHSIPNGFFRLLMQAGSGSAIDISTGPGKIRGTSDTGAEYLLCGQCETDFNKEFDAPLVNGLKLLDQKIQNIGFSARISFSHEQMAQAIASIIWRCCESGASHYDGTSVDDTHLAQLKHLLTTPREQILRECSVRIDRLQYSSEDGSDQEIISRLIVAPVPCSVVTGKGNLAKSFGFYFAMQGFLIHLIVPKLPYFKNRKSGYLKRGFTTLHAPPTSILKYPPLMRMLVIARAKYEAGEVTEGVLKMTSKKSQMRTNIQSPSDPQVL